MEVGEGQDINQALLELRKLVKQEYGRPWHKRRYGYYESPSVLRRKCKKMKQRQTSSPSFYVGQQELLARTGPDMAVGR